MKKDEHNKNANEVNIRRNEDEQKKKNENEVNIERLKERLKERRKKGEEGEPEVLCRTRGNAGVPSS